MNAHRAGLWSTRAMPTISRARVLRVCTALTLLGMAARPTLAQDTLSRVPPGTVITLDDAIRIALVQNSSVRIAKNATILDSLGVVQAKNAFLPNLGASASSSQGFLGGSQSSNSFGTNFGISGGMTLFNGGQNTNLLREAELNLRAGGQDLGRARQAVVFTVASDFLNLITQQEQLRVQQQNLVAQQEQLTQIQAFTNAGTRNIGDLYQQQAATAAAQLAVATARRTTDLAKVDLIQELLLDPRQDYTFQTPPASADSAARPNFNLDSLINIALLQRADLQAQMLRVQAAERDIAVARAGRSPVVTANVGYNDGFNTSGDGSIASQLDARRGGSIGIGVTLPILDRGATSIAEQRAKLALDNEMLALRDQTQGVALDVRRAYLNYLSASEQVTASDAQVKAATLAVEATSARYRVGLATFVEVSLARATLVQAQSSLVNARASLVFQQALMSYYTGVLDSSNLRLGR